MEANLKNINGKIGIKKAILLVISYVGEIKDSDKPQKE